MQTRFLLTNGRSIYPAYLNAGAKMALKRQLEETDLKMYCACSAKEEPLYYSVGSDLRIFPLHKFYKHKTWCSRYDSGNNTRSSATVYDDEGNVTVYTSFQPKSFTMTAMGEEEELTELQLIRKALKEEEKKKEKERLKELGLEAEKTEPLPTFNLMKLVRLINHDTYMDRIAAGKYPFLSLDYFNSAVNAHLKHVKVYGLPKTLKELTLSEDKVQFFYAPLVNIGQAKIVYQGYKGEVSRFAPDSVIAKAEVAFEKAYDVSVYDYLHGNTVMVAGFMYEKMNRNNQMYRCIGRMAFFPVTENGMYCDSLLEIDIVNAIMRVCKKTGRLFIYAEEDKGSLVGYIRNKETGVEAPVFFNGKGRGYGDIFYACHDKVPSEEELEAFVAAVE